MKSISGLQIASEIKNNLREHNFREQIVPCLAVILLGEQADSVLYVNLKDKAVSYIGGRFRLLRMDQTAQSQDLLRIIQDLNQDNDVNGIILQLPLPAELELHRDTFLSAIDPLKDVDGFHPENRGRLIGGEPFFISCAALACLEVIQRRLPDLTNKKVNLVGDSFDLIMPLAVLLLKHQCQVGLYPDFSIKALADCDVIVIEKGGPAVIKEFQGNGPDLVIDAGFYMTPDGIVGNVDQRAVEPYHGGLLPVPGGLGPILIAKLMENMNNAARRRA